MEKISSENYDFYFLKNSIAERDINQIIEIQENCFKCEKGERSWPLFSCPDEIAESE